jgi:hypothetical protein
MPAREPTTMPLLVTGPTCLLCDEALPAGRPCFATSGAWLGPDDPLRTFCGAGLHWSCYAAWPERRRFARSYVDSWVERARLGARQEQAYLDDEVFVTVDAYPSVREATVRLYETGSSRQVRFDDWPHFLAEPPADEDLHPLEAGALESARARLARSVPTLDALLGGVDPTRKLAVIAAAKLRSKAERAARVGQRTHSRERQAAFKAETEARYREALAKGLRCPLCDVVSRGYRLHEVGGDRLRIVCRRCGRSFDQRNLPT